MRNARQDEADNDEQQVIRASVIDILFIETEYDRIEEIDDQKSGLYYHEKPKQ